MQDNKKILEVARADLEAERREILDFIAGFQYAKLPTDLHRLISDLLVEELNEKNERIESLRESLIYIDEREFNGMLVQAEAGEVAFD